MWKTHGRVYLNLLLTPSQLYWYLVGQPWHSKVDIIDLSCNFFGSSPCLPFRREQICKILVEKNFEPNAQIFSFLSNVNWLLFRSLLLQSYLQWQLDAVCKILKTWRTARSIQYCKEWPWRFIEGVDKGLLSKKLNTYPITLSTKNEVIHFFSLE